MSRGKCKGWEEGLDPLLGKGKDKRMFECLTPISVRVTSEDLHGSGGPELRVTPVSVPRIGGKPVGDGTRGHGT